MDKNINCLFNEDYWKYQNLINGIKEEVRRVARTIPGFERTEGGCIKIKIRPWSAVAEKWMGSELSYFNECVDLSADPVWTDVCDHGVTFRIFPTRGYLVWRKDGSPMDCQGYAALMTELAMHDLSVSGVPLPSEFAWKPEWYIEENGWSTRKGATCTTVRLNGSSFLDLCVCVCTSMGPENDQQCSLAGMLAAQKFFSRKLLDTGSSDDDIMENGFLDILCASEFKLCPDFNSIQET